MKLSCTVIEDMLPMYYDKVCSEESAALVEEHLQDCPNCNHILSELRSDIDIPEKKVDDIRPLKKIQRSYKKMRMRWLIVVAVIVILIPVAFLVGNDHRQHSEYSQEEALVCANAFMTALTDGDYAKAFSYWDVEAKRHAWLMDHDFKEEDLVNLETDGLKKFCEQGEKLEALGGIESFEFIGISDPHYYNHRGTELYNVSYRVKFDGKYELFGVSVTKYGIDHIGAADGLIAHPLSLITMWCEWLWQDYQGCYFDPNLKEYVYYEKEN